MAPTRRDTLARRGASLDEKEDFTVSSVLAHPQLLLSSEVPPWYYQEFIHTGYRPTKNSILFCFRSLTYIHNETANIYSHLLPAPIALVLALLVSRYFDANFPDASSRDRLIFQLYLSTSVVCFTVSSLYHTLLCHSQFYFNLWVRIDYVTILFQILGSFISGIYLGFYCEPILQNIYWTMVCTAYAYSQAYALYLTASQDRNPSFARRLHRTSPPPTEPEMAPTSDLQLCGDRLLGLWPHNPRRHHLPIWTAR
jgi:predicted membrane channel-forming protein YqfA (hemolysin III family)